MCCLLLAACSQRTSSTDPPLAPTTPVATTRQTSPLVTPVPGKSDSESDAPALTVTLRLMTYNVLWGGGVDREFDKNIAASYQVNRLDDIVRVVREVDPDLLAIEEAAGWDRGQPSVAEQVAVRLGLHYVLAPDGTDLNVVLFSRFPIEDAAYESRLPNDFYSGFNGVLLKARLVLENDARLTVYVPHLNSQSSAVRACQVQALLKLSGEQPADASLLLGDLNSRPTSREGNTMSAAGWQFLGAESTWTVDQIWAGPGVSFRTPRVLKTTATRALSDHLPAALEVTLDVPYAQAPPPSTQARQLSDACPPPAPTSVAGR